MNKLTKKVNKSQLVKEFVSSLNGILGLTNRELELLQFLINDELNSSNTSLVDIDVTSTENRKIINNVLGITADNLSRYIKKFRQKGILIRDKINNSDKVNPVLIPEVIKDRVQLTIILRIDDGIETK